MPPLLFEPYANIRNHIHAAGISLDTLPPAGGRRSRLEPWLHRASLPDAAINWASRPYFQETLRYLTTFPEKPIDGVIEFIRSDEAAAIRQQDHIALSNTINYYEYFPETLGIDPARISTRSLAGLFNISEISLLPHLTNNSFDICEQKLQLHASRGPSTIHTLLRKPLLQSLKWHEPWGV